MSLYSFSSGFEKYREAFTLCMENGKGFKNFQNTWYQGSPWLNLAIECGDDAWFDYLLKENFPVDGADKKGWIPLHLATYTGNQSMVERLLKHDRHVVNSETEKGETALHIAAERGHVQICKHLLDNWAHAGILNLEQESPLQIALKKGNVDCAQVLSEHGADLNTIIEKCRTPTHEAVHLGLSKWEVDDKDGMTPLTLAAQEGRTDHIWSLLNAGANADLAGYPCEILPIHLATIYDHFDCVRVLVPHTSQYALLKACYRATVHDWLPHFLNHDTGYNNVKRALSERGVSILHLAIEHGRIEILEYLLKCDVDPNIYVTQIDPPIFDGHDDFEDLSGETALGLACHKGSVEMVTVLLENGAEFTLGNPCICNALHRALKPDYSPEFIRFLVRRGADINSHKDLHYDGIPAALRFALGHPELLRELLALGGRFRNWGLEEFGSMGPMLAEMANDPSKGDVLLRVLSVLLHFAPRHTFRPLCSSLKWICDANPTGLLVEWTYLDQELASPETLKQLCRRKTREVLMMRKGFILESDVSVLNLPHFLEEYLMFR